MAAMLRLISYLAPSIPAGFFELIAKAISESSGIDVDLRFEDSISGPLPGDPNPFGDGTADVGFVCSPTYRWLRQELHLLPAPVSVDGRANGKPVYFADVIVHAASRVTGFDELRGARWGYNDRNSRTGWLTMMEKIAPLTPAQFFSDVIHAGSHLESLRLVQEGAVDAAALDSNVLLNVFGRAPDIAKSLTTIESWGPFPMPPIVIRAGVPTDTREATRQSLLRAHERFAEELKSFGFVKFVDVDGAAY